MQLHTEITVSSGIEIFVFNDRIEVRSPGALLSTIKIFGLQELNGAHESRNPMVARVLKDHKYMRELGEGMRRIFEAMEQNDLEKPQLVSSGSSFSVVLSNRSVFNQREEEWLSVFRSQELSRLQKRIVVAGMDGKELSPDDIYHAMNTEDRDTYDFEVTGLRKSNVLTQIRSTTSAQQIAKSKRIVKSKIPRFRVSQPVTAKSHSQQTVQQPPTFIESRGRELFPEETGVFVSNLDLTTTEAELRSILQRFGKVRKVTMNRACGLVP